MNTEANAAPIAMGSVPIPLATQPAVDRIDPDAMTLKVSEVAKLAGVSRTIIWKRHSTGSMPPKNRYGRFNRKQIEKWIEDGMPDTRRRR